MRTMSALVVVLALACAASCGDATSRESGGIYGSDRYTGRVSAQVLTPDGPRDPGKETGTGSAQFVPLGGGRSRLEVKANIRRENDSGFVVEGRETGDGWRGSSEALKVEIDRNGDISGGGIANHHRITFDGRATAQRIDLVVETEKMAVAAGESLRAAADAPRSRS